jgi:hypothetical protein
LIAKRFAIEHRGRNGDVLCIFFATLGGDHDAVDFLIAFGRLGRWLFRRLR